MGKYLVVVEKKAQKELKEHYKSGDKASIKKIEQIFDELTEHPQTGIGQPEQLKYSMAGYWSRQINKKDRLIYKIEDKTITVTIVAAKGHYSDRVVFETYPRANSCPLNTNIICIASCKKTVFL